MGDENMTDERETFLDRARSSRFVGSEVYADMRKTEGGKTTTTRETDRGLYIIRLDTNTDEITATLDNRYSRQAYRWKRPGMFKRLLEMITE